MKPFGHLGMTPFTVRAFVEQLVRDHHAQALAALEETNLQGPAAQALHELAQMLLNRER